MFLSFRSRAADIVLRVTLKAAPAVSKPGGSHETHHIHVHMASRHFHRRRAGYRRRVSTNCLRAERSADGDVESQSCEIDIPSRPAAETQYHNNASGRPKSHVHL